jgi:hypothetical protein
VVALERLVLFGINEWESGISIQPQLKGSVLRGLLRDSMVHSSSVEIPLKKTLL